MKDDVFKEFFFDGGGGRYSLAIKHVTHYIKIYMHIVCYYSEKGREEKKDKRKKVLLCACVRIGFKRDTNVQNGGT